MTYATRNDLIAYYGSDEVNRVAAMGSDDDASSELLDAVISDASDEVDTYIGGRYSLPLESIPKILKSKCLALAWHTLHRKVGNDVAMVEADNARRWLRDVASGKATLGLDSAEQPITKASDDFQVIEQDKGDDAVGTFNRDAMIGFGGDGGLY